MSSSESEAVEAAMREHDSSDVETSLGQEKHHIRESHVSDDAKQFSEAEEEYGSAQSEQEQKETRSTEQEEEEVPGIFDSAILMSQEAGIEHVIFGGSGSESASEHRSEEEEEERPEPRRKRSAPSASAKAASTAMSTKRQRRALTKKTAKDLSPHSSIDSSAAIDDKILEARKDFETALAQIRPHRARKPDDSISVELDEAAIELCTRMRHAYEEDLEAFSRAEPALAKIRMLPMVVETMTKRPMHEVLLDNQILGVVKSWLEPLPDGSMPAINIRKSLLQVLRLLPIDQMHLRESGLGRIIMHYYQRPKELSEIKKLSGELVAHWSRPMISRGSLHERDDMERNNGHGTILQSVEYKKKLAHKHADEKEPEKYQRLTKHLQKLRTKQNKSGPSF